MVLGDSANCHKIMGRQTHLSTQNDVVQLPTKGEKTGREKDEQSHLDFVSS